jgi:hypothetical protein
MDVLPAPAEAQAAAEHQLGIGEAVPGLPKTLRRDRLAVDLESVTSSDRRIAAAA